jgi:DNA-binding NarL/FixJ family response regulator
LRDSAALEPDLIIIDLDLRGLRVEEHVGALRRAFPSATTIGLSTHDDERRAALGAGVTACVSKTESPHKLVEMLNEVEDADGT